MTEDKTQIEVSKISLEEMRLSYDQVTAMHNGVRSRILIALGSAFAFLNYIYQNGVDSIPTQTYGIINYALAFVLTIAGIITLLISLAPVKWRIPGEMDVLRGSQKMSQVELLDYLRNEYAVAYNINIKHNQKKNVLFIVSIFLLLFGGTLLLIFKNFVVKGGT